VREEHGACRLAGHLQERSGKLEQLGLNTTLSTRFAFLADSHPAHEHASASLRDMLSFDDNINQLKITRVLDVLRCNALGAENPSRVVLKG